MYRVLDDDGAATGVPSAMAIFAPRHAMPHIAASMVLVHRSLIIAAPWMADLGGAARSWPGTLRRDSGPPPDRPGHRTKGQVRRLWRDAAGIYCCGLVGFSFPPFTVRKKKN